MQMMLFGVIHRVPSHTGADRAFLDTKPHPQSVRLLTVPLSMVQVPNSVADCCGYGHATEGGQFQ